ncbi:DUF7373 family lipoprotein [Nocardia heshunensis]
MQIPGLRRVGSLTGALALTAAVLSGCASTSGTPVAAEIDVRKLNVGAYPTEPLDYRTEYSHITSYGQVLAFARLADAVALGTDIDPSLAYGGLHEKSADPTGSWGVLGAAVTPVLKSNDAVLGFSAASSSKPLAEPLNYGMAKNFEPFGGADRNPGATAVNITVVQFADTQHAQTAAEQMESADFGVAADQNVHLMLDRYPGAKSHWRPGVPTMVATLAQGQYVVNVYVQRPDSDLPALKALTEKAFATQLPMLDRLPPLSRRDIKRLDYDPYGMLRRTLHPGRNARPDLDTEITHGARGFLNLRTDRNTWKELFDNAGVDRISVTEGGAQLIRARDAGAAVALWSGIKPLQPAKVDDTSGVPDIFCGENPKPTHQEWPVTWDADNRYYCTLHYDRYVARVASSQLVDVQQRAAAQYALLANSQYL